jgi:hypothetical protein
MAVKSYFSSESLQIVFAKSDDENYKQSFSNVSKDAQDDDLYTFATKISACCDYEPTAVKKICTYQLIEEE